MSARLSSIIAIEEMRSLFGNSEFSAAQWDAVAGLRFVSARRHVAFEVIEHVERVYYSMAEIVEKLNACAGDDCYACDWHYQIDEQGRVYQDFVSVSYRFPA